MNYYLSVDGGGTKLVTLLFDDGLNLLGVGRGLSINPNFSDPEAIADSMRLSISEALKDCPSNALRHVYIAMPGPSQTYLRLLKEKINVEGCTFMNEGVMCLLAGLMKTRGIVALSGTGSGIFNIDGSEFTHLGGWGALIGDEGSGYYIGREAITACIKASDTRGPDTMLLELLTQEWKLRKVWDIADIIYAGREYRRKIASLCPLVCRAAEAGDDIAVNILKNAGYEMAQQIIAIKRRDSVPDDKEIVVAGSVWKGNSFMFDSFVKNVIASHPAIRINIPLFEPVMGGVVKTVLEQYGEARNEIRELLKERFSGFVYNF